MEDQLGAILGNPALMQQIMDMAQSLGQSAPPTQTEPPQQSFSEIDPATIGNIMSIAGKTQIDRNQKALLHALQPYLTGERLQKLEKAMRAARIAGAVSTFLPAGKIPFLSGR